MCTVVGGWVRVWELVFFCFCFFFFLMRLFVFVSVSESMWYACGWERVCCWHCYCKNFRLHTAFVFTFEQFIKYCHAWWMNRQNLSGTWTKRNGTKVYVWCDNFCFGLNFKSTICTTLCKCLFVFFFLKFSKKKKRDKKKNIWCRSTTKRTTQRRFFFSLPVKAEVCSMNWIEK